MFSKSKPYHPINQIVYGKIHFSTFGQVLDNKNNVAPSFCSLFRPTAL